jgi:ParB family chromosome partitioning protein
MQNDTMEMEAEEVGNEVPEAQNEVGKALQQTLLELPLAEIADSPYQPRTKVNEGADVELLDSIREHGILQPLTVRALLTGYELLGGHRRKRLGLVLEITRAPCLVRYGVTDREAAEIALIDNTMRSDIDPIDEAFGYARLQNDFGMAVDEIVQKTSKSRSAIYDALRVAKLPERALELLRDERLTYSHGVALCACGLELDEHGDAFADIFAQRAFDEAMIVSELEDAIRDWKRAREEAAAAAAEQEKPPLPMENEDDSDRESSGSSNKSQEKSTSGTSEKEKSSSDLPPAPEGQMWALVGEEDFKFCEENGIAVEEAFEKMHKMVDMGTPLGLTKTA